MEILTGVNKHKKVVEIDMICEICKKLYKDFRVPAGLKGKGMRYARERGAFLLPNSGVLAVPHFSCVKKRISDMLLAGKKEEVRSLANRNMMTLDGYLASLGL